jgi:hypothetical protein
MILLVIFLVDGAIIHPSTAENPLYYNYCATLLQSSIYSSVTFKFSHPLSLHTQNISMLHDTILTQVISQHVALSTIAIVPNFADRCLCQQYNNIIMLPEIIGVCVNYEYNRRNAIKKQHDISTMVPGTFVRITAGSKYE